MKLLVFAHTPPPHHGQSYMVKLMLDGLGGDRRRAAVGKERTEIECYHVNCRYSEDLEDIGSFRFEKTLLLVRYCLEAIWCRFRYGIRIFYYVPAPGKRAALYRDWIVMCACRPFFRHFIHHWHAVGLGDWLQREGFGFERWVTHRLLGRPALGLALAIPSMRDALWFRSHRVEVVANGIPDPCPDFDTAIKPRRDARLAARRRLMGGRDPGAPAQPAALGDDGNICHVLFLAHCTRHKGLFDTIEGVSLANASLRAGGIPLRLRLTIAGSFLDEEEEKLCRAQIAQVPEMLTYAGFVSGPDKLALLQTADCFCFPTYYAAEGQPVNLIEALAFGLPIVTTQWRAIPETLPPGETRFVSPQAPPAVAAALLAAALQDGTPLRDHFLNHFTVRHFLAKLQEEFQALEGAAPALTGGFTASR